MLMKKIVLFFLILILGQTIGLGMAVDTVIYDEDYSLDAGYYLYYTLSVTSVPVYAHIEMSCDDDINLYIMNDTETQKWIDGETPWGYFYSDVSSLDIYNTFTKTGQWYIILDNTDSVITDKSGHIKITAVDEIPTTTIVPTTTVPTTTTKEETPREGKAGSAKGEVTVTVPALSYRAWSVETTSDNVKVKVKFLCDGCDINFKVANDANFKAWQGGSTAAFGFIYNDKIEFEEEIILPEADTWWFILDNTDSLLTSKIVTISISVVSSGASGFELIIVPIVATVIALYRRKRNR